jgi:hypothetical protein
MQFNTKHTKVYKKSTKEIVFLVLFALFFFVSFVLNCILLRRI